MIKKLLFFIGFLPIVSYSCSEEKNPQRIITKDPVTSNSTIPRMPTKKATILSHDRIYQDILPKYKEFAKVDVFIPGNWVVDGWFIKDYRTQKDESGFRIPFNSNFFHNTEDIKQSKHIKITTKEDFNKLIINRFSELHNFNEDRQIKELFELIFLNNKDVYQELESKNIFIFPHNYWASQNENNDFLIPLYKDGKIIISYIRNIYSMYHTDGIPEALSWLVFSLPKDHELNIHNPLNEISPDSELYKVELYKWYINEFLKYSK